MTTTPNSSSDPAPRPRRGKLVRRILLVIGIALVALIARPAWFLWNVAQHDIADRPAVPVGTIDDASALNATAVAEVWSIPEDPGEAERQLAEVLTRSQHDRLKVSIAGARHTMGGHTIAPDGIVIDMRPFRTLSLDANSNMLTAGAGAIWHDIIGYLDPQGRSVQVMQSNDSFTVGGSISVNCHGWQYGHPPIASTVESFRRMKADGSIVTCSRTENTELFSLVLGGYGLFGIITTVQLRLRPRVKVRRVVELGETADIMARVEQRIRERYLYGDFQFATDSSRDSFLARGVFSCYQPVPAETPLTPNPTRFHPEDWARLTFYSHKYKRRAFDTYSSRYLQTSGQIYWHDWQLSAAYVDNYHADLDRALKARVKATEMITELYVPRPALASFMTEAARALRRREADVIYGTVRLIEKDDESVLAWARERWACIVLNLHVQHTSAAIAAAADAFRDLIDVAIGHGGSYYLTYHRWARKDQVETCHPRMREYLELKRRHDPGEVFQSTWYQHYRRMFES